MTMLIQKVFQGLQKNSYLYKSKLENDCEKKLSEERKIIPRAYYAFTIFN